MNAIFKRLRGKRILILGFGREGKSSLAFIKKYLPHAIVGIADKNESAFKDLNINPDNPVTPNNPKIYFGDNYFDAVNDYDIVLKTPGISLLGKNIDLSKITSQTDLFLEEFHSQIIGITGTKGKSTTSTLIYHLLKESGRDAILAGNIGIPIFDIIERITNKSIIVFELSAHQLQFIHRSPHIGILLNVFEEHLDHFGTFETYRSAKLNIIKKMGEKDWGRLALRERPEARRVLQARDVPEQLAGLQLRRDELPVRLLHELEAAERVAHLDRAVLGRREPVRAAAPEVRAVAPFRGVERVAVELVVPDEVPFPPGREEARRVPGDGVRLGADEGEGFERCGSHGRNGLDGPDGPDGRGEAVEDSSAAADALQCNSPPCSWR